MDESEWRDIGSTEKQDIETDIVHNANTSIGLTIVKTVYEYLDKNEDAHVLSDWLSDLGYYLFFNNFGEECPYRIDLKTNTSMDGMLALGNIDMERVKRDRRRAVRIIAALAKENHPILNVTNDSADDRRILYNVIEDARFLGLTEEQIILTEYTSKLPQLPDKWEL